MDEPAGVSDQKPAAKIFLSCGQREASPEIECAKKIKEELKAIGFEVFLAIEVQTAQALTDRIYQELESSDYFIFIDFKREAIKPPSDQPVSANSENSSIAGRCSPTKNLPSRIS